jgi:hypothetical protein
MKLMVHLIYHEVVYVGENYEGAHYKSDDFPSSFFLSTMEPELNNVALRLNSLFLENISFADLITMRKETCQEDELARGVRQQSQGTFFQFATIVSVILILPNISGMR